MSKQANMNPVSAMTWFMSFLTWASLAPIRAGEIHETARTGQLERIESLLEINPQLIHSRDKQGFTPLLAAVAGCQNDAAEVLLIHKADVNARVTDPVEEGKETKIKTARPSTGPTALHLAVMVGCKPVVETLLAHHADVNAADELGATPLHNAADLDHREIATLLLAHHSDVNARTISGWTPLHCSAQKGCREMTRILLDHNADPSIKDEGGKTPLMWATQFGHKAIIEIFTIYRIEINERAVSAIRCGDTVLAEDLISKGANVHLQQDPDGCTALMYAVWGNHSDTVESLLARGVDVNAKDKIAGSGQTALIWATLGNHAASVMALLEKGAEVNLTAANGRTALMYAAWGGFEEIVRALLGKGADVNMKAENGETALSFAEKGEHPGIAVLLKKAGAR